MKNLRFILDSFNINKVRHGDCIGADADFHEECLKRGYYIHIHPPEISGQRAWCKGNKSEEVKGYLHRNREIVNHSTILIAVPGTMKKTRKSGTWLSWCHSKPIK